MKWTKIKINERDCRGLYLWFDFTGSEISSEDAKILKIKNDYKIQIKLKIDGRIAKKVYPFHKSKTLLGAIDFVNDKRLGLIEEYKARGTLRAEKKVSKPIVKIRTFEDDFNSYIEDISLKGAKKGTIENFNSTYITWYKNRWNTSEDITVESIKELIKIMKKKGKSGNTIRNVLSPLKAFISLNWKEVNKYIPKLADKRTFSWKLEDIKKLTTGMRNYSRVFTNTTQIGKGYQMQAIFEFLLRGRRINEVLSLKYSDIDIQGGVYIIRAENSKGGNKQDYELDETLVSKIPEQKSEYLFDTTAATVRRHFKLLLEDLSLPPINLHDIRHMAATTALENGATIAEVSRMLGHGSIAVTESRYVNKKASMATKASTSFLEALK